jgi:hypothetical protein
MSRARLGESDRLAAIRRLDEHARRIDAAAFTPADLERGIAAERQQKLALGGRTAADPVPE